MAKSETANVVCFLWNEGFRNYTPDHVNILANACKHFYKRDHKFICVTDVKNGFNENVTVLPMPKAAKRAANLSAPQGSRFPSSYRRLWCFSEEAKILGDRILLLDIDCMVLGDLTKLLRPNTDFVGWKPLSIWGKEQRIGGGTWLLRTGTIPWLWDNFIKDPVKMIEQTKAKGWNGSDQAIMSRFLYDKYPRWKQFCGIYGSQDGAMFWDLPPKDSLIVHFNGDAKPWNQNKMWMKAYCNHFR